MMITEDAFILGALQYLHYMTQWIINEIVGYRGKVKLYGRMFACIFGVHEAYSPTKNLAMLQVETY